MGFFEFYLNVSYDCMIDVNFVLGLKVRRCVMRGIGGNG